MSFLVATTIDVTVILGVALLLTAVLRHRSAALRHAILAAALLIAAAAPLLEATVPQWSVAVLRTPASIESSAVQLTSMTPVPAAPVPAATPDATAFNWRAVIVALWMAGALIGVAGLLTGLFRLMRITSRCAHVNDGRWREVADEVARDFALTPVTILQSAEPALLVTCGLVRPKIVLPAGCDTWTDARRRIVLAHELAHIRRGDWATQMIGEAVRVIYWFHPLAWLACRRLRQESEYACDDAVIGRGVEATDYATHLLDVARHAIGQRALWTAAPAIANPSTLERRISAMLNHQRNRDPLTRRSVSFVVAAMLAVAVPVVAMSATTEPLSTPRVVGADVPLSAMPMGQPAAAPAPRARVDAAPAAQEKPASIRGTLYDPLGGLLPGVALTLTDQVVGASYAATTDRTGSFAFAELQPATYELTAQLPGFATVSSVMPIGAGANVERRITMPIGSLQETILVVCELSALPPTPRPRAVLNPGPNRGVPPTTATVPFSGGIGGQIRAPRQIAKANPICPNHVGVDTVVVLTARVGIDGYLADIRLANRGDEKPAQEIVDSAIEAVRLWQYTPTLLNGVPVEAHISMTVSYDWR